LRWRFYQTKLSQIACRGEMESEKLVIDSACRQGQEPDLTRNAHARAMIFDLFNRQSGSRQQLYWT
jgi:hypothetical protein